MEFRTLLAEKIKFIDLTNSLEKQLETANMEKEIYEINAKELTLELNETKKEKEQFLSIENELKSQLEKALNEKKVLHILHFNIKINFKVLVCLFSIYVYFFVCVV